jgi:hypothetical protein
MPLTTVVVPTVTLPDDATIVQLVPLRVHATPLTVVIDGDDVPVPPC